VSVGLPNLAADGERMENFQGAGSICMRFVPTHCFPIDYIILMTCTEGPRILGNGRSLEVDHF
jgi:hypothetical protein